MALPASGEIKFSDLATELGASTSNFAIALAATGTYATINTSSTSYPNASQPHQISEWFSYDHSAGGGYTNTHYYDMTASSGNSLVRTASTSPFNLSTSQDLSISVWVRQDSSGSANQVIWDFNNGVANNNNRFFLQWQTSTNHFLARFRTNASNFDLQWDLNDNSGVTGLSSGNWSSTNRGNVNGDGFCLLTLTYDASQSSGANAFKLYWNGSLMSTTTGSTANSRTTAAVNVVCIGNNATNYTTSAGAFDGGVDEFKIFTSLLTASNVTSLYNSGSPANAANSFSTGLLTEITFDSNVNDSAGSFPTTTNNTGSRTAY